MDEIITAIEEDILPSDAEEIVLATVTAVSESGLKLLIDGEETSSEKLYKCNNSVVYDVGDRVKISRVSGSILVDYVIGFPASEPSEVHGIPSGGSTGQALLKNSNNNYDVKWGNVDGLPTGGTTGQILSKKSNTNYDVEWVSATSDTIANSTYSIKLDSATFTPQGTSGTISLGTSLRKFKDLYASGTIYLGESNSRIGFFGHTVSARQTVASSATVSTLITALKAYGLIA